MTNAVLAKEQRPPAASPGACGAQGAAGAPSRYGARVGAGASLAARRHGARPATLAGASFVLLLGVGRGGLQLGIT